MIIQFTAVKNMTCDMENILMWFNNNQMVANPSKIQYMILVMGNNKDSIIIGNNTLKASNTVTLLGITIDKKLTFNEHIGNICKLANNKIKCLARIRNMLDKRQARIIYNTFIL